VLGRGGGPDDADVAAQLDVRQRLVDQPLDLRAPPRALHLAGQDKAVFPAGQRDALFAEARVLGQQPLDLRLRVLVQR